MEPNNHVPANVLPASPEFSDAGNSRSLQQASHQGWPSVDVLPNVAVQTLDPAPASSGDFFCVLTQANLSGKDAGMLSDTRRTPENLPADQQIIAPMGGVMRNSGKQPAVQSGRKRKTLSSSLAPVGREKATAVGLVDALTERFAAPAHTQAEREVISFKEINNLQTKSKLLCCHFNSQGDLLATAGEDGKVLIWDLGNGNVNSGEGHAHFVTDIRFRPNSTVFATSSFDRTVMIWDAAKPSNPFQNLVEHAGHVMSIDFHPTNVGLLSSCDSNDDIRLWDVNTGDFKLILKLLVQMQGGGKQVRFQPQLGDTLAVSTRNIINIFNVETNNIQKKLQGHVKDVHSICWDMSGNFMASVCEDSARIWSVSEGKCIHELRSSGNKFQSCTFHPRYGQVLVIGSDKFLELWNPISQSNITLPCSEHDGIISSLADSPPNGTIASVSHDQWIKIWQ
ncbi:transcriptional corepressor LEUNIG_HOMOLOG-like isoform X1 [Lycium ferocissimum]|uniref:transcriptional corepressor LEUNIG_HOMOLOG-like isoform X1 n=1 Tax=Lycium ferocissimum TaxID=112874 RepID=UPI00281669B0|nr:transcriptional corepressor LEUNIG_HOMOLOG-like isoform X1 [Lycium ferocissimum]